MDGITRRELAARAGKGAALTALSYSRIQGANSRIQVGLIGLGIRGPMLLTGIQKVPAAEVAALCDVYPERIDRAQRNAPGAKGFTDYRKVLEMKELAAVAIATPDHWHAPMAIEAMNAGKDVYVEKPLTLRMEEGPQVIRAARVNDRVCQVGMQRRSGTAYLETKRDYFDSGRMGKMLVFRCWYHKNPVHFMKAPPELREKPANLDWARYLGPVKWRDWDPQQYWNFRAYLDFGGGQVTDLFTHWIDVLHMFTGEDVPCAAVAVGGIYSFKDGRTAPDTIHLGLEYPSGCTASFDAALDACMAGNGAEFIGSKGRLITNNRQFEFQPGETGAAPVVKTYLDEPAWAHMANFLDCVRSRRRPNADVLIGHRAAQAAHLGNIAWVRSKRIRFDPAREEIVE